MAMFQLEIAFLLELALLAAGLVLLHLGRQGTAPLLKAAGFVLIVGAVITAACSGYFGVRYHVQGEFDHAYPSLHRMTEHRGKMMDPGMMRHQMTRKRMRAEPHEPGEDMPGGQRPMGEHHPDPERVPPQGER